MQYVRDRTEMWRVKMAQKEGTCEEPQPAHEIDVECDAAVSDEEDEEPEQPKMSVWMAFGLLTIIYAVRDCSP